MWDRALFIIARGWALDCVVLVLLILLVRKKLIRTDAWFFFLFLLSSMYVHYVMTVVKIDRVVGLKGDLIERLTFSGSVTYQVNSLGGLLLMCGLLIATKRVCGEMRKRRGN